MKKVIIGFSMLFLAVLGMQCSPPDDDVYWNNVEVEIKDAIKVENKANYIVGDTLFFELNFSRYLEEEGYSNLLDIYETSGVDEFTYSFGLLKYSAFSDIYEGVNIDDQYIIAEKGLIGDYSQPSAILNSNKDTYESRIGIILKEEGEYQLDFDYMYISSAYNTDKPRVGLNHIISEANPLLLNFTVSK
ncbi:hypothetical protein [uncultured Maribacter sp.]|uniref:hypothetical protein n=1 Tax=uncultured Maribacter sp. TaxID=431308 RepID=UPI00261E947A|nr:hypothetical protein [uncultured Maribacter sp.]